MSDATQESTRTLAGSAGSTSELADHTPLLIDATAAAAIPALGARTLWALTKCDALPSQRIGRSVRYCPSELRAWIAAGCPTNPGAADLVRRHTGRQR